MEVSFCGDRAERLATWEDAVIPTFPLLFPSGMLPKCWTRRPSREGFAGQDMHLPSLQRSISDVVAEYDLKRAAISDAIEAFEKAGRDLTMAATIGGTYGKTQIDTGHIYEQSLQSSLLKSAWQHIYDGLNIAVIASPNDKQRFQQAMESPPPFTLDNISGTFGRFVADPRGNILRGLAEVFCGLDPAYKSHDKVKIGVAKLPKRVIIERVGEYSSYGRDKLEAILNALAAYQGKPLVTHRELYALLKSEDALLNDGEIADRSYEEPMQIVGRGIRLKRFQNGNAHMHFEPATLLDINRALAEFYGDVLPDDVDEKPTERRASTAVSKDLQYYPTPVKVVDEVLDGLGNLKGKRVLEPQCGCGRFLDGLSKRGAKANGIEVDSGRAAISRAKGHTVLLANFLNTEPLEWADFDEVVMNPPFHGKGYARHVLHALKFLKPGGRLTAILPATARYDHGLLDGRWQDLSVGSFSESGTNINVTIFTIYKPEATTGESDGLRL